VSLQPELTVVGFDESHVREYSRAQTNELDRSDEYAITDLSLGIDEVERWPSAVAKGCETHARRHSRCR
jgi:hypothetical protein